jgi:hypothetical protein
MFESSSSGISPSDEEYEEYEDEEDVTFVTSSLSSHAAFPAAMSLAVVNIKANLSLFPFEEKNSSSDYFFLCLLPEELRCIGAELKVKMFYLEETCCPFDPLIQDKPAFVEEDCKYMEIKKSKLHEEQI